MGRGSVLYDDGSMQTAVYDPTDQHPQMQMNFVFDPQGQLIASSTFFDL